MCGSCGLLFYSSKFKAAVEVEVTSISLPPSPEYCAIEDHKDLVTFQEHPSNFANSLITYSRRKYAYYY